MKQNKLPLYIAGALALLVLPFILQGFGNAWVRIADVALLYVLLALGLNIVVGYAGLLDLGYVAFFALGAYMFALAGIAAFDRNFPRHSCYVSRMVCILRFGSSFRLRLWLQVLLA